jgi:2-oxo-4-hydroxy-4-carboxy--5-ureidoimidazoline (OHCU) decarboxylase
MLAVALVDFHDAMEMVLDAANQKDPAKLVALYPEVSDKLKVVEAELNDAEIQDIRANLDELLTLSKVPHSDALPAKGDSLKSSFVKVYLKRG